MQPKLSLGSAASLEAPQADLAVVVQLPADILAHRPEGREGHTCNVMEKPAGNWGNALSVSVSPAVLGPIRTSLDGVDGDSASYTHNKPHLEPTTALAHCPKSFECELESLMGHAVKGVLLGER